MKSLVMWNSTKDQTIILQTDIHGLISKEKKLIIFLDVVTGCCYDLDITNLHDEAI